MLNILVVSCYFYNLQLTTYNLQPATGQQSSYLYSIVLQIANYVNLLISKVTFIQNIGARSPAPTTITSPLSPIAGF